MIDVQWFTQACEMAGVDLEGQDCAMLCSQLDDMREVLPYILTIAGGFADWPQARAALQAAAVSHARPTHMRPPASPGMPGRTSAKTELRAPLTSLVIASSVYWKPDWDERGPETAYVERLLNAARLEAGKFEDSPELFIKFE